MGEGRVRGGRKGAGEKELGRREGMGRWKELGRREGAQVITNRLVWAEDEGKDPQTYWGHDLELSRSCDVIGHVIIRYPTYHFLKVFHCN